jgi:hypothetical protein
MKLIQRDHWGQPTCHECLEASDAVVELSDGDGLDRTYRLCYACLSKACGLVGVALMDAKERRD